MEILAVFPPLFAFLIAGLFHRQIGVAGAQFVTCAGVILAAFCSLVIFFDVILDSDVRTITLANWIVVSCTSIFHDV